MCTLRDTVVFLAGAETMHTLGHVFMHYYVTFPVHTAFWDVTPGMNNWGIVVNGVVAVLLLVWAWKMSK
jgi:hypothetical protein